MVVTLIKEKATSITAHNPVLKKVMLQHIENNIKRFRVKIPMFFENRKYIIKTVNDSDELRRVLDLRHRVFYKELLGRDHPLRTDCDKFDFVADHLMVICKKTGKCVGTYRFISSIYSNKFYSSTEFKINHVHQLVGNKLELGRACIDPGFRGANMVVAMLWKGIVEYARLTHTRYMFGCSSIKTVDMYEIANLQNYFIENNFYSKNITITPKLHMKINHLRSYKSFLTDIEAFDSKLASPMIPPLLRFYLKSGAVICGDPVIDTEFKCTDFFTLFDMEQFSKKSEKKFAA